MGCPSYNFIDVNMINNNGEENNITFEKRKWCIWTMFPTNFGKVLATVLIFSFLKYCKILHNLLFECTFASQALKLIVGIS